MRICRLPQFSHSIFFCIDKYILHNFLLRIDFDANYLQVECLFPKWNANIEINCEN